MIADSLALEPDLVGKALNQQRFKILTDIAKELTGSVLFPINFDVTLSIRNALRQNKPLAELEAIIRLDPLTCCRLLRLARQRHASEVKTLSEAFSILGVDLIRAEAGRITNTQMARFRCLTDFSVWAGDLWASSLDVAATAHVIAKNLTSIDPQEAMFGALCKDLAIYYMLYRAVQYPDLCARPLSLKHLVINWHSGISQSLLGALKLPPQLIEAIHVKPLADGPAVPKNLGEVIHVSTVLADVLFGSSNTLDETEGMARQLGERYLSLQDEIRTCRKELGSLPH